MQGLKETVREPGRIRKKFLSLKLLKKALLSLSSCWQGITFNSSQGVEEAKPTDKPDLILISTSTMDMQN